MMSTAHTYEVNLQWSAERKGVLSSPILNASIEVATPPEFPKGMPGIWSPEHLFVAAVNSCLMTTFLAVAENSKLEFSHFDCAAEGILEQVDGKYSITKIILRPKVVVSASVNHDRVKRVLDISEKHCLISNSIVSEVHLEPEIVTA